MRLPRTSLVCRAEHRRKGLGFVYDRHAEAAEALLLRWSMIARPMAALSGAAPTT
jgi:hypothetical protein